MKSIILMGIKHCGKSTQGKLLSRHFNCAFFDTDDEISSAEGKSPRDIYNQDGKDAFIQAEYKACENLSSKISDEMCVIATGGGICNNPKALDALHKLGTFVFLNSDEETACNRIIREIKFDDNQKMSNLPAYIAKENPDSLNDVRKIFHNFYTERQKIYKSICDIEVILEQSTSKQENMEKILQSIN